MGGGEDVTIVLYVHVHAHAHTHACTYTRMHIHTHTHTHQNDSGIVGQVQRFSEQLVLCAKALSVLASGRRQYEIALATSNMESTESLKTGKC